MADIKISELSQAESLSLSDLMESAIPYNGGFQSRRMTIAQLSNYLENSVLHNALDTTTKNIIGAINEILHDLANYYTTSQTYSKTEVDTLIAGVSGLHFEVVKQLPTTNIDMNTIYLVPKQDVGTQDIYDEYICLDDTTTPATWEKIGTTEIDLSDYVTDTELTTILNDYVTSSGLSTILASYATTSAMTTALADKVDKVIGKGLSTEDYTTTEKAKLNGIESGAEVNVQSDWNQTDNTKDDFIKNKPTIPDELADLTDDSTHRLVSDTEKSTWNGKAELTDVDKAELNTWNLLRQPYFHNSGTSSGTTRTVNADGSVTFTGTATASYHFNLKRYTQEWKLPKGKYRIIGCPVGGSDTTYFLRVQKYTTSLATLATDYGYGAEFTLTEETTMHIVASIISGYAIQGSLTFKPFIVPKEKVDEKVKQTAISDSSNANYRLLLSKNANDTEETDGVYKDGHLYFNPYDETFTTTNASFSTAVISTATVTSLITGQYYFNRGSGNAVAMLEANSASTTSNPTFVTLPASSGTLALQSESVLWSHNNLLGAKNLIPYPYINGHGSYYVRNNVTISVNENGVISASGSNPSSGFGYGLSTKAKPIILDPTQSYIMSGLNGGSSSKVRFLLDLWTASQNPVTDAYTTRLYEADGETTIPSGYKYLQITLYFYTGAASLFPLTVSPMLRLASIADSTFKPYADTNRNLSMNKADLRLIADTEKTSTASRAYAVNELMFYDGNLYRVKTAIASGGSITLNTNVVATTLSAEIKAIRDALNI